MCPVSYLHVHSELQRQAKIKRQSDSQKMKTPAESDKDGNYTSYHFVVCPYWFLASDDAFSYSDMDESDFSDIGEELDKPGQRRNKKGEPSEAELEKLLLENMTSEEDEEEEEEARPSRAKKSKKSASSDQTSEMVSRLNKLTSCCLMLTEISAAKPCRCLLQQMRFAIYY